MRFYYKKKQRLKRKKWIQNLFEEGKTHYSYPLKCYFLPHAALGVHQLFLTVPKRIVKSAVVRKKITRRMREAYRLSQHTLGSHTKGDHLLIGIVFVGKKAECGNYHAIEKSIHKSIAHINASLTA